VKPGHAKLVEMPLSAATRVALRRGVTVVIRYTVQALDRTASSRLSGTLRLRHTRA
jgi:hypothetical protein